MMNGRRNWSLLSGVIALALVSMACGLSVPEGVPSADTIATSVAATVNAITQEPPTPTVIPTEVVKTSVPTDAPTPDEPALGTPVSVSFVTPDGNAYYWNETMATPVALTTSGDVERAIVSTDGSRILLIKSSDYFTYSLDVINADGTDLRPLITPAGFDALPRADQAIAAAPSQVEWLPGSSTILFTTRSLFEGPGLLIDQNLYKLNTDSGELTVLLSVSDQWNYMFFISPDQQKLAVTTPQAINIYRIDGTLIAESVLTYPFVNTASEYAWVPEPVWSMDNTTLITAIPPADPWSETPVESAVWRVPADGTTGRLLFSTVMQFSPVGIASIAPDLSRLLYLKKIGAPTDSTFSLRLVNTDGSATIDYITGAIFNLPDWSPDSLKFYYYVDEVGAFVGQVGLSPVTVPDFLNARNVTWINDDQFIGVSGPEGGWRLLLGGVSTPAQVIFTAPEGDGYFSYTVNR